MIPRADREAGFTLVELLVSLALIGLAAVLIAQSFSFDHRALLSLQDRASTGEEVSAAQNLIRLKLINLAPQAAFETGTPGVDMDAEPDHLEFLTTSPQLGAPLVRYRLSLSGKGDLDLLPTTSGGGTPETDAALLHGVKSLDISYYGVTGPDRTRGWVSSWNTANGPPELVRIQLGFKDAGRRIWPLLIVRPGANVDTACVLDPDTGLCRGRS
ncbi:MAG: prepilin-type N-terminal cleavage/methylation domain-containing protein [Caulobacteraceae bacterium]|nr:prepilin-type N-terminal cleavage/methylation domain-containing protein [Caulobacteraceae bacterium]